MARCTIAATMTVPVVAGRVPEVLRIAVCAGFVAFFPLAVAASRLAGTVFWLLTLVGIAVWIQQRAQLLPGRWRQAMLAVATVPVALNLTSMLVYDLQWRVVSWVPFLALPALVVLARAVALDLRVLLYGAILGSTAAAAVALYGRFGLGAPRTDWTALNAILFGQAALSYAIVSMIGWRWRLPVPWPALLISTIAGLVAFALSGTRGGLLVLPIVAFALLRANPGARPNTAPRAPSSDTPAIARRLADRSPHERGFGASVARRPGRAAAIASATVGLAVFVALHSPMAERFGEIDDEVSGYASGNIAHSSIGSRLAMWKSAVVLAADRPVFGIGAQQFQHGLAALRKQGRFPADVELFRHAHNSYLTVAAEYGAVGIGAWALVLAAVWWLLGTAEPPARRIGRCLLGCWLVFALTNDVLAHQTTLRLLVLLLAGCLGMVARI